MCSAFFAGGLGVCVVVVVGSVVATLSAPPPQTVWVWKMVMKRMSIAIARRIRDVPLVAQSASVAPSQRGAERASLLVLALGARSDSIPCARYYIRALVLD